MTAKQTAAEVLDCEFLEIRCRLLDIAASLDRIRRGTQPSAVDSDSRLARVREAIRVLDDADGNRAERIQMVFSLPFQEDWR